jgi:hypothetical protein
MAMSHPAVTVSAPPRHQPVMRAMTGFGKVRSISPRQRRTFPRSSSRTRSGWLSMSREYCFRSWPAQKFSPAPVSTITRVSWS